MQKPDSLVIEIFSRIIKGEILSDHDIKQYQGVLMDMAMSNNITPDEFKKRVTKFRQSIPNFLKKLDEDLSELVNVKEKTFKMIEDRKKWLDSLPKYVDTLDAPEVIQFARSLTEDLYNYSDAERLLKVPRQTLKKYALKEMHGFKEYPSGKTMKLHRADIINYYREKYFKNYLPF